MFFFQSEGVNLHPFPNLQNKKSGLQLLQLFTFPFSLLYKVGIKGNEFMKQL